MTRIQRRVQALLAMAALGAAGMFLGGVGWFGVDLGVVGAALLYAALWVFVVYLGRHPGQVFPEGWSLAEKRAWVGFLFIVLISFHIANLFAVLPDLGAKADQLRNPATRSLSINLGMLIVCWTVVSAMLRKQERGSVELDERDLRIAHAGTRVADGVTTLLIIGLVVALAALPDYSRTWLRPLIAANVLMALLVARAFVENAYTVLQYHRERG